MKHLIKNAYIVSVDPRIGNLPSGDILVDNGEIADIGVGLNADVDEVFDATGHIASPGLVDAHHHIWQAALRGLTADWSLLDYAAGIRMQVAALFRPQDMYAACFHGALECINAGVTTVADYCHNIMTPDHAEEALRGVRASGLRAVWCYGFNSPPLAHPHFRDHSARFELLKRMAGQHFASDDARVVLGVSPEEPFFWNDGVQQGAQQFQAGRELGARIFIHGNSATHPITGRYTRDAGVIHDAGLLGPDITLVHMGWTTAEEWRQVADSGAAVAFTPETEIQMGMNPPAIGIAGQHKIPFGFGIDIISNNSADLRIGLRMAVQVERLRLCTESGVSGLSRRGVGVTCAEALEWGTMGGARACGLDHRIGSLTPGKAADILLHDGNSLGLAGWERTNPEGALMLHASPDTLAAVMVDGVFVKRDFKVVQAQTAGRVMRDTCAHIGDGVARLGGSQGMLARGYDILMETLATPLH